MSMIILQSPVPLFGALQDLVSTLPAHLQEHSDVNLFASNTTNMWCICVNMYSMYSVYTLCVHVCVSCAC